MKETGCAGLHQARCNFCGRRVEDEFAERGNALPIAQVLKESGRTVGRLDAALQRAGDGHEALNAGAQRFHPVIEHLAQHNDAIGLKCLDGAWRD